MWDSVLEASVASLSPEQAGPFWDAGPRGLPHMEEGLEGSRRAAADTPVLCPQLPIQRGLQPGPAVHEHPLPRLV